MRMWVQSLASHSGCGLRIWCAMSCRVVHRHGLDLELWWLWYWWAAATLLWPLAWKTPYVTDAALKSKSKKKKKKKKKPTKPRRERERRNDVLMRNQQTLFELEGNVDRNNESQEDWFLLQMWVKWDWGAMDKNSQGWTKTFLEDLAKELAWILMLQAGKSAT